MSATVSLQVGGDFGDYRIDSVIGRGGMGVVYRAWQRRMNRAVALKVLPAELARDPVYRTRFGREAAALAQLDSPNVIQIYDHGELGGNLYLATQLVQGPDLGRVIEGGPLPPRRALRIAAQVAAALGDGHAAGVVHRDVKPSNVLMRPRAEHDDGDFVYLCDFGIARSATETGEDAVTGTQTGGIIGTLGYMAPERLDGRPASPASDVYSLGCLLWALLTGAAPYQGLQPQVIVGHMQGPVRQVHADDERTRMLNALLAAMMAKDPTQRPAVAAVRGRIRDILAMPGDPADRPTRPTTLPEPVVRSLRGTRGRWIAAAATVVTAAAGTLAWFLLTEPTRSAPDRLAAATPVGVTCQDTAVPDAAAEAGALAQRLCDTGAEVGRLRLVALSDSGAVDRYLRTEAGQDPQTLLDGSCPRNIPTRQGWERGTLLCYVLGPNTRYAWTFDELSVVAVLDGSAQASYPGDLEPVDAFFTDARYP